MDIFRPSEQSCFQTVQWQHQDPGNASFRLTSSTGAINNAEKGELDPLGTNAGATDQRVLPSAFKFAFYPGFASAGMSSIPRASSTVFRRRAVKLPG